MTCARCLTCDGSGKRRIRLRLRSCASCEGYGFHFFSTTERARDYLRRARKEGR